MKFSELKPGDCFRYVGVDDAEAVTTTVATTVAEEWGEMLRIQEGGSDANALRLKTYTLVHVHDDSRVVKLRVLKSIIL